MNNFKSSNESRGQRNRASRWGWGRRDNNDQVRYGEGHEGRDERPVTSDYGSNPSLNQNRDDQNYGNNYYGNRESREENSYDGNRYADRPNERSQHFGRFSSDYNYSGRDQANRDQSNRENRDYNGRLVDRNFNRGSNQDIGRRSDSDYNKDSSRSADRNRGWGDNPSTESYGLGGIDYITGFGLNRGDSYYDEARGFGGSGSGFGMSGYGFGGSERDSGNYYSNGNWKGDASHFGKAPKNYKRSDDRLKEEVSEALTFDHDIDASDIDVSVKDGVVTLSGSVPERKMKHEAELCAERVYGVVDIKNDLRKESKIFGRMSEDEDTKSTSSKSGKLKPNQM